MPEDRRGCSGSRLFLRGRRGGGSYETNRDAHDENEPEQQSAVKAVQQPEVDTGKPIGNSRPKDDGEEVPAGYEAEKERDTRVDARTEKGAVGGEKQANQGYDDDNFEERHHRFGRVERAAMQESNRSGEPVLYCQRDGGLIRLAA